MEKRHVVAKKGYENGEKKKRVGAGKEKGNGFMGGNGSAGCTH